MNILLDAILRRNERMLSSDERMKRIYRGIVGILLTYTVIETNLYNYDHVVHDDGIIRIGPLTDTHGVIDELGICLKDCDNYQLVLFFYYHGNNYEWATWIKELTDDEKENLLNYLEETIDKFKRDYY